MMTDELERLREGFREAGPLAPDEEVKKVTVERAMNAFDEQNANQTQGSHLGTRLKDTATAVLETLIGRKPMKLNPTLAGGASLSVLVLAVLSANYVQTDLKNPFTGTETAQTPTLIGKKQAADKRAPVPEERDADLESLVTARERFERNAGQEKAKTEAAQGIGSSVTSVQSAQPPVVALDSVRELAVTPQGTVVSNAPAPMAMKRSASRQQKLSDRMRTDTYRDQGRDKFEETVANPVKVASEDPVSTFSIDVDTASYAFMRASLNNNVLPQKNAVRVEELINYFPYDYARPGDKSAPFKATTAVYPSPWNKANKIVHIGIKGFDMKRAEKPRSNLVFLLDTSGSMNAPNKLPLLKNSMKLLLERLSPEDTVAVVTYAGSAGTALEPTRVKEKAKILAALNSLRSAGSTAGAEGIRQAYELAQQNFDKTGVNRVILATDGDFNVGITSDEELKSFVERKRRTGIFLSVLGFGMGNYNDQLMQTLAQNGNGNAAYIDNLNEARKVLVEEANSTLFTIAKDVKIQVEFNPARVAEYRLIGYETRALNREDFANDKVDAGDIGAGHTVTALYEITPAGSANRLVGDLRYGKKVGGQDSSTGKVDEYAFLKIRYKLPESEASTLITQPIASAQEHKSVDSAPQEARFATSVAAFGQLLKGGRHTGSHDFDDVIALAQGAKGKDEFGYRAEFINLVRLAKSASALEPLSSKQPPPQHRR